MGQRAILNETEAFVRETLKHAEGGHDWWHIQRVRNTAMTIGRHEGADLFIIELGALLHDIADSKFHGGNDEIGPAKAAEFLQSIGCNQKDIYHVQNIVRYISYKGGHQSKNFRSLELAVVQDADRLDAIGAIGIARAFNYGGFKNRALHDPDVPPNLQMDAETYKKNNGPTINHFYEKLLLLKDLMNTGSGRRMAAERHAYLLGFLDQFFREWAGEI